MNIASHGTGGGPTRFPANTKVCEFPDLAFVRENGTTSRLALPSGNGQPIFHFTQNKTSMPGTPPTELFEPFERLIEIDVLGEKMLVPENNTILRCLQYINMESISYGDFCWNGDCTNCQIWYQRPGEDKELSCLSCRKRIIEGMKITRLSKFIDLTSKPSW